MRPAAPGDIGERHAPDSRILEGLVRQRNLPRDRRLEDLLRFLQADFRFEGADAVGDQLDLLGQTVELAEQVDQPRGIPQAQKLEMHDDQNQIGDLEGGEIRRVKSDARIQDHGAEGRAQHAQQALRISGSMAAASCIEMGCGKTKSPEPC